MFRHLPSRDHRISSFRQRLASDSSPFTIGSLLDLLISSVPNSPSTKMKKSGSPTGFMGIIHIEREGQINELTIAKCVLRVVAKGLSIHLEFESEIFDIESGSLVKEFTNNYEIKLSSIVDDQQIVGQFVGIWVDMKRKWDRADA